MRKSALFMHKNAFLNRAFCPTHPKLYNQKYFELLVPNGRILYYFVEYSIIFVK